MPTTAPIFLVEDDEVDTEAVRRALRKADIGNPFISASDGVEALDILLGRNGKSVQQPCIMLLDINMPRMNGLKLLEELRKDESLKRNVVFMLTTSAMEADKQAAYESQAAGYVLKENLQEFADILANYCEINEL